jgi:hypothetical protein
MADVMRRLGAKGPVAMIGYVFLSVARAAKQLLAESPAE